MSTVLGPQATFATNPARRAFLGRFFGDPQSFPSSAPHPIPAERIALLKEIALRWEHQLPERAVPALRAGDACVGHGICASVCPTGALRAVATPGTRGLEFTARDCFACGACVVVCPEQAMRLEGRDSAPATTERIIHHDSRMCARCASSSSTSIAPATCS